MTDDSIALLKQKNAELQKELTFTRELLKAANSLIIRWDKNGIIQYINDFGLSFLGYSTEELIGQPVMKLLPRVDITTGRDLSLLVEDIANNPEQHKFVPNENITKDGRIVWVTWTNKGIFDEQGNVQEILAIGNDITDLKQAERTLWEYQEKLNAAFESMEEAIFITDQEGNLVHINTAFATFHKFKDKTECTNRLADYSEILDIFHEDGTLATLDEWAIPRALRGETCTNVEHTLTRKDTGETWVGSYNFGPMFDQEGNIIGAIVVGRDISAYKKALQEVQQSEYKFRSLFQNNLDAVFLTHPDGTIVACNPKACEMFGRTEDELCSLGRAGVLDESDIKLKVGLETRQKNNMVSAIEVTAIRANGERFPAEVDSVILNQDPPQAFVILRDISERKLAEKNRLEFERQLYQKHKMEAVGFMAGGMAHNFNNNLSIILGNVELSQMKQPPDSEVISLLENAKIAVRRSRDLVQKIITYSRQGVTHKAPMQLKTIIDETIDLLSSTLPTTITLTKSYSLDGESKLINADPSQIQEVLINLCNNAIHAMDEKGELTISLDLVNLEEKNIPAQYDCLPGHYAKLSVRDNGCGMPAEMLDKIFDPFYSTKEDYEGAGMGLATVQGIVAQHGGIIKVNSILGQGTTFDLYFPLTEPTDTIEPEAEEMPLLKGTESILFVDDDDKLTTLGEQLLNALGYQVTTATDSIEALKMFTANADGFDLVITDQTMPGLTGKELIAEIKKVKADTPTILCTGYSSKVDEDKAAKLGISAFMMEPLDLPVLSQTVRQVLDGDKEI